MALFGLEGLLNQHTKRYRLLINKLIELFEQIQYEKKERTIEVLTKLMEKPEQRNIKITLFTK